MTLTGTDIPRDAIGSRVFLMAGGRTQLRYASGGVRTTGQDDSVLLFGLGANTAIDEVVVQWANGSVERFPGPAINAEADLTQGSGTIVSAPLLLTGKQVASRGENVHFLLLCAMAMDCDVRGWDIDGERLDTTRRSLNYVFNTAGAKTVAASVNLASGKALRIATEITISP